MNTYLIINPEAIQENMMNNTEIIKQMIPLYLGQGVEDFKALEDAIESQIHNEIKLKAHHIKPTMQYLGATNLRMKFQELEEKAGKADSIIELTTLFLSIKKEFQLAMSELEDYQTKLD